MASPDDVIADFRSRFPNGCSVDIYRQSGPLCSVTTIRRMFGSWSEFVSAAVGVDRSPYRRPIIKCLHCGKETTNQRFCCLTCAATFNNSRRLPATKPCPRCGLPISVSRTVCTACAKKPLSLSTTIGELSCSSRTQAHARIRQQARQIFGRSDRPKRCMKCGYDRIFHVCHVIAIEKFPLTATLAEVNDLQNLVALCPNHHWEFDNGCLTLHHIEQLDGSLRITTIFGPESYPA